jgi:predicted DNA-binding protein (MmcQ/YjbR family)
MIKGKISILSFMFVLGVAGTVLTSCGGTSKEIETNDGKDNVALTGKESREEYIEVKDTEATNRAQWRTETLAKVKDNEQQLALLKEKLEKNTPADAMQKKQWIKLHDKNTAVMEKLQSYSETRDTSWTEFSNSVSADLKEIDQSMGAVTAESTNK